jgi:hypothetical protein
MKDIVNHPPHYTSHPSGVECIQITEHMNFNLGNAVKYIWRAGLKSDDPTTDLLKAVFYINREVGRMKGAAPIAAEESPRRGRPKLVAKRRGRPLGSKNRSKA